ncbi:MAG TPA: 5'-3' exonuclease H3TH domain-containing protein [Patescibacteria group bacterium]
MQKLLLIDGNAMLHRAYHALPALTNLQGEPIQAAYGFFSMLLNVLQDQKPTHLAVCFDRGAPTIRQSMFAGYHEHRPELPNDFVPQIVQVHELLAKLGVQIFELDGYEGDDLIGTITAKVMAQGSVAPQLRSTSSASPANAHRGIPSRTTLRLKQDLEVVILTGDRDFLQLVGPQVKVLMPLVGISKTVLFDEAKVEEKYGVKPTQFIDYKALIGDPSDGYPGVTGIGPKTAAGLLQKFGTFENLYKQIGQLPEKVGLKLATDAEQAALAKQLATIIIDAPIQFDLKKCAVATFNYQVLRQAFKEQGFKTLTARFDAFFKFADREEQQLGLL